MATNAAAQNAIKKRLINKLEVKRTEANSFTYILIEVNQLFKINISFGFAFVPTFLWCKVM